jgi:hypothetical protein
MTKSTSVYDFDGDEEIAKAYRYASSCAALGCCLYDLIAKHGRRAPDKKEIEVYEIEPPTDQDLTQICRSLLILRQLRQSAWDSFRCVLHDLESLRGLGELVKRWPDGTAGTAHEALADMGNAMCIFLESLVGPIHTGGESRTDSHAPVEDVDERQAIANLRRQFPDVCVVTLRMGSPWETLGRLRVEARREAHRAEVARARGESPPQNKQLLGCPGSGPKTRKSSRMPRDPKLEARDKWLYRQACAKPKITYKKIVAQLKKCHVEKGWVLITSIQAVKKNAMQYAERHGLEPPPARHNL